ncbi:MAG: hypothetical protein IR153_10135 [Flavobacterium sp.]|nr:hypothetical protein [Flavobacterium sp.]
MENLEIHYYLENDLHSMDAFIKNKAEAELLKIFKEIATFLELDLSLEIEAVEEGGIKEFFKILNSKKNRKQTQRVLIAVGVIFSGVVTNIISDQFTNNSELEELQIEETKLNIQKLKKDLVEEENPDNYHVTVVNNITFQLSNNDKIKFHRSNFYTQLLAEPKVEKVSITEVDENKKPISEEKTVNRSDFKNFIIEKVKIESEFIENANIEIVSPVLKSGKMKWRGYYDSKPISFNLLDSEFKNMVSNREVSFVNGTSIKCTIELEKEMDDDGNVKIVEINVFDVTNVFEGQSSIVTKRGKQIIEAKNQIKFTFEE